MEKQKLQFVVSEDMVRIIKKITVHVSLFILAIVGRSIFQYFPSVEPLIPLYIFLSFYGGKIFALEGAVAFYFSNYFVYGGQGPWTIFQVFGTYLACYVSHKLPKRREYLYLGTILGISIYEFVVNIGWMFSTGIFNWKYAFVPSLPYSLTHIISSLGFVMVFESIFMRGER